MQHTMHNLIYNLKLLLSLLIITSVTIFSHSICAKNLQIAIVAPLSGPYSSYGTYMLSGASQAIKDLNKFLPQGNQLELIPFDDRSQPEIAEKIAKEISKNNNIPAIIGHMNSATTMATLDLYANKGKLLISPTVTTTKLSQRGIFTFFRLCGSDAQQANVLAKFIANDLQSQLIAVVYDPDIYGKELADQFIEKLSSLDKTPGLYQAIPKGTKNFTQLLAKFKELNIDAVFFAGLYPEVEALATAMHKNKIQLPLITGDSLALTKLLQKTKINATRSIMVSFGSTGASNLKGKQIIKDMRKENLLVGGYTLYAYAAVEAIAQAHEATKSYNGHKLAYWLHQNIVDSALGNLAWDTNGDIMDNNYQIYIWNKQGEYIPIQTD